ncbi:MAG: long-chain fatty acid--CoA ligase [Alphaproteobacteria bacterium]|nr:MAG: long-chain fatty acid--CoA ligase [Alphaproteobacteria bacterium]
MNGLMQKFPLNLAYILEHAARFHSQQEIVSQTIEGGMHRYTYADALVRTKKLANFLKDYGLEQGDRVATLAWNGYRHLESWFAISGYGAICTTVNPRLFPEQISYILTHSKSRILLVDITFVPLLEKIQHELVHLEQVIILTDREHMPDHTIDGALCYEDVLAATEEDAFDWPVLDEETGASLCYTSGTTGDPKGVMYTHRSNLLMSAMTIGPDVFNLSSMTTMLVVVPMFHANAWGVVYAGPMVGAKLVLPGPHLDGKSIYEIIEREEITSSLAVPTVWTGLLEYLQKNHLTLPLMKEVIIGGSAVSKSMVKAFQQDYGIEVIHGWGMTELNPLGTANRPIAAQRHFTEEERLDYSLKQGRPLFGVEMCIQDDEGRHLPHDGKSAGRLMVRGPWVVAKYYRQETEILDQDGWFDTGDIATLDDYGFMQITDRAKDIIKSGGEWISSIDLENSAMSHPRIQLAAIIGIPHPKWEERPLLIVQNNGDKTPEEAEIMDYLSSRVAKWWLPDAICFVDSIPLAASGKIDKKALRKEFQDFTLPII